MTITFRIDDGYDAREPGPAIITVHQLGSLRDLLAKQGERTGMPLLLSEYGDPTEADFSFDARICPLALAMVSACFDHYRPAIAVLDEAQFRGRRIRVWRYGPTRDIHLSLSSSPDAAPELEVANGNACALLETLGLDPASVGVIAIADLRQRLTDPRIRRQLDDDPQLACYVPTLVAMAALKPIEGDLSLAWA